eukprot:1540982-Ditylum_brightwellii.AAC.1
MLKSQHHMDQDKPIIGELGQWNTTRPDLFCALLEGSSGWYMDGNETTSPEVDDSIKAAFNHQE